jgi:hypothetical protein
MFERGNLEHFGGALPGSKGTTVNIEDGLAEPPWKTVQTALDGLFASLEGVDAPPDYSYPSLIRYLSDPTAAPTDHARDMGDFAALMACRNDPARSTSPRHVVQLIKKASGGVHVYLADQNAYVRETLDGEFPELRVFDLTIGEAFVETMIPGFYIETSRFADLRCLSRMRREIRRTGMRSSRENTVKLISVLLGLAPPAQ